MTNLLSASVLGLARRTSSQLSLKMKKLMVLMVAFVMAACSGENAWPDFSVFGSDAVERDAHVVDASEYFKNISLYEGKTVYLFIRQVVGRQDEKGVRHFDRRIIGGNSTLVPSKKILESWLNAGFDNQASYTVTFRVNTKDGSDGRKIFYVAEFDRFIVNSEDGPRYRFDDPLPVLLPNGLPAGRAARPFAEVVKDFKDVVLYPERYAGKRIISSITVFEQDLKSYDDKYWIIRDRDVNVLLPKSPVQRQIKAIDIRFDADLIGSLRSTNDGLLLTIEDLWVR